MRIMSCLLIIFLFGCVSQKSLFPSVQKSEQDDYGYSKENPILIGYYGNWQRNADLAITFLSKLKYNGKPLQCVLHATVDKPINQPRKKKLLLQNRFAMPTNLGGIFLDLYVMVPKGSNDTLKIYFDEEIKGEVRIPKNMEFDANQTNNIWR